MIVNSIKERPKSKTRRVERAERAESTHKASISITSKHQLKEEQVPHSNAPLMAPRRAATVEKKPKKKTNRKKQQQQKRRLDEEERRLEEQEQIRRQELELHRIQQLKKLTKEETERLEKEFPQYYQRCKQLESLTMISLQKEEESKEWERYVSDAEMIDVDNEKDISGILLNMQENIEVSFDNESLIRWLNFVQRIILELANRHDQALAANNHQKAYYYHSQRSALIQSIRQKLEEIVRYNVDEFDKILTIKNKELRQKMCPTLSLQNERTISEIVFKKSEERLKYEVYRPILNTQHTRFTLWFNLIKVGYRPKLLAFPRQKADGKEREQTSGIEIEVPRQYIQNYTIVSCLRTINNPYSSQHSSLLPLGETVEISFYPFFPLPRVNPKFMLKKICEVEKQETSHKSKPTLKKVYYEPKDPNEKLAVRINIPKAKDMYLDNLLRVATFTQDGGWSSTGITDLKVNVRENNIEFNCNRIFPMALALPLDIDAPYKSFFLRCVGQETALLDLQSNTTHLSSKRFKMQFEIGRSFVKLVSIDTNAPCLQSILNVEMSSAQLLAALSAKAILMRLTDCEVKKIEGSKNLDSETKLVEDLGFMVTSFAFKSSSFNRTAPRTEIVVQSKVQADFESRDIPDDEHPWYHFLFNMNKCGVLNKKLKQFKDEYLPGTSTHINMERLVKESPKVFSEQETAHRTEWAKAYPVFVQNIKKFVKQIRIFCL